MAIRQQKRFTPKDMVERWKELNISETRIEELISAREFKHIIIEGDLAGKLERRQIYFDRSLWPHGEHNYLNLSSTEIALVAKSEGEWKREKPTHVVYISREAVEDYEWRNNIPVSQAGHAPVDANGLDISKAAENLRIAIQADSYFYGQGNIRTNRGHRDQIDEWLQKEYQHLSGNARDSIVDVVNRKKGGPPSIT